MKRNWTNWFEKITFLLFCIFAGISTGVLPAFVLYFLYFLSCLLTGKLQEFKWPMIWNPVDPIYIFAWIAGLSGAVIGIANFFRKS